MPICLESWQESSVDFTVDCLDDEAVFLEDEKESSSVVLVDEQHFPEPEKEIAKDSINDKKEIGIDTSVFETGYLVDELFD